MENLRKMWKKLGKTMELEENVEKIWEKNGKTLGKTMEISYENVEKHQENVEKLEKTM